MTGTVFLKALALWLAILVLAVLNGTLREKILMPSLGSFGALVASGIILSGCIFLAAFAGAPWFGKLAPPAWALIGLSWLALTLAFEFGFGRFVQHKAWTELFAAYTFKGGNIWPLVLVVILVSPWLAAKWRGLV
ncbi:MAG: hypothetical protein WBO23_16400 [Burkholderiales bacterium]